LDKCCPSRKIFSSLFVGEIPHRAKLFDGMSKPLIATLLGIELEIKKVFNRDVKRFRNSFATVVTGHFKTSQSGSNQNQPL